jgi:hypothetical protein
MYVNGSEPAAVLKKKSGWWHDFFILYTSVLSIILLVRKQG